MDISEMKSWDDYWVRFTALLEALRLKSQQNVAAQLEEAAKYVNGMTDGWHDFLTELETLRARSGNELDQQEALQLDLLIEQLKVALNNR